MKRPHHVILIIAGVLGATGAGTGAAYALGFRVNTTSSVPIGIYRIEGQPSGRGQIVAYCPPDTSTFRMARDRGFVLGGMACPGGYRPLFKPVAAIAGDTVTIGAGGIAVNGAALPNTRAKGRDSEGRALPHVSAGRYRVDRDQVWLVSTYSPRSFDARYFGPVPAIGIVGVARPIFTVEG